MFRALKLWKKIGRSSFGWNLLRRSSPVVGFVETCTAVCNVYSCWHFMAWLALSARSSSCFFSLFFFFLFDGKRDSKRFFPCFAIAPDPSVKPEIRESSIKSDLGRRKKGRQRLRSLVLSLFCHAVQRLDWQIKNGRTDGGLSFARLQAGSRCWQQSFYCVFVREKERETASSIYVICFLCGGSCSTSSYFTAFVQLAVDA